MSDIFTLLSSIITKLKTVARSVPTKVSELEQDVTVSWNDLADKPVIPEPFSGSYNDLTDKPVIPEHTWASLPDKPFYDEEVVKEIFPTTNLSAKPNVPSSTGLPRLELGKTYIVEWAGVEYRCEAKMSVSHPSFIFIGNGRLFNASQDEDTGEPFKILTRTLNPDKLSEVYATEYNYYKVRVSVIDKVTTPLESRYIPSVSWQDVTDKPFGEDISWEFRYGKDIMSYAWSLVSNDIYESTDTDMINVVTEDNSIVIPTKLRVLRNMEEHIFDAKHNDELYPGWTWWGNDSFLGHDGAEDTGEPFAVVYDGTSVSIRQVGNAQRSVIIYALKVVSTDTIPERFLPIDTITQSVIEALPSAEGGSF